MKTKKVFKKKLTLKKDTIANLDYAELRKIQGGISRTVCRTDCVTNCIQCPSMKCP